MPTIRIPESVHQRVHDHLFGAPGEHFAFLHANTTTSQERPAFIVTDATLVPDGSVTVGRDGWEIDPDFVVEIVNDAIRNGHALIEAHNHGGTRPRPSCTDLDQYAEFVPYILDSLPRHPYAATIWAGRSIYGHYFTPDSDGPISSIVTAGQRLRHLAADTQAEDDPTAVRQLPWFTNAGQQQLGALHVAVVGASGTGSHILLQLPYLGIREITIIDPETLDETNLNRVVTATPADIGSTKTTIARRAIKSIAPNATVETHTTDLRHPDALDSLKGVDLIFGCIDNDGARLILNELAVAYSIPYIDVGVGIDAEGGTIEIAGSRIAVVMPDGPCLHCMGEIDRDEARYYLSAPDQQQEMRDRGYVTGTDTPAASVVSLNGTAASLALNELAVLISGTRPVNPHSQVDLLGTGQTVPAQWVTPTRMNRKPGCLTCSLERTGDAIDLTRYQTPPRGRPRALPPQS